MKRAGHARFQAGNSTGSAAGAVSDERSTSCRSSDRLSRFGERAFIDPRVKGVFERDHQLDAFERAQSELLNRGAGPKIAAAGVLGDERRQRIRAVRHVLSFPATGNPLADQRSLELSRAFGARQRLLPARRARGEPSDDRQAARLAARTMASASVSGSRTSTACTRSVASA